MSDTATRAAATVARMVDDWQKLRDTITTAAAGHPRHLCWACEQRPRVTFAPGIPVGLCTACRDEALTESGDQ